MAGCIGDKLEASPFGQGSTRFYTRPSTNGYSVEGVSVLGGVYSGSTDTPILVDINGQGEGKTHVQVWTNLVMGSEKVVTLVRGCF